MKVVARFIAARMARDRRRALRQSASATATMATTTNAIEAVTFRAAHTAPVQTTGVRGRADRPRRASRDRTPSSPAVSDRTPATAAGPCVLGSPVRAKAMKAPLIDRRAALLLRAGTDKVRRDGGVVKGERHVEAVMRAPLAAVDRRRPVELIHERRAPIPRVARRGDRLRSPGRARIANRWSRQRTRRPASIADATRDTSR